MFALLRVPGLCLRDEWCLQTTVSWPEFDPHRKALWERIKTSKSVRPVFPTSRSKGERYVFSSSGVAEVVHYAKENELSVIVQFPQLFGLDAAYLDSRRTTLFTEQLLYEFLPLQNREPFRAWSQLTFEELALVTDHPTELQRLNRVNPFATLTSTRFAFLHSPNQMGSETTTLMRPHTFPKNAALRVHTSAVFVPRNPSGLTLGAVCLAEKLPYTLGEDFTPTLQFLHLGGSNADTLFFLKRKHSEMTVEVCHVGYKPAIDVDFRSPSTPSMYFHYDAEAETWMPLSYAELQTLIPQLRAFAENHTSTLIQPCAQIDTARFRLQRSLSTAVAWETLRSWDEDTLSVAQKGVIENLTRIAIAINVVQSEQKKVPLPRWVRRNLRPLRLELPELTTAERREVIKRFVPPRWSFDVFGNAVSFAQRLGASPTIDTPLRAQRFLLDFDLPTSLQPHQAIRLGEVAICQRSESTVIKSNDIPPSILGAGRMPFMPLAIGDLRGVGDLAWSRLIASNKHSHNFRYYIRSILRHHSLPTGECWITAINDDRASYNVMLLYVALCHLKPFQPTLTPEEEPFRAWFSFLGRTLMQGHHGSTAMVASSEEGDTIRPVLSSDDPLVRFLYARKYRDSGQIGSPSLFGTIAISSFVAPPLLRSKQLHKWMQSVEANLHSFPHELQEMDLHALCSLLWKHRSLPLFDEVFHKSTQHFVTTFHPGTSPRHEKNRAKLLEDILFPPPAPGELAPSIAALIRGTLTVSGGGGLLD